MVVVKGKKIAKDSRREKGKREDILEHDGAISDEELEKEVEELEENLEELPSEQMHYEVDASKPLAQVKKGDSIYVDGKEFTVDAHYVLIDHGSTKEMAIELFDSATDKDFQLRYFDDQANSTLEFYELQDIMYAKKPFKNIAW